MDNLFKKMKVRSIVLLMLVLMLSACEQQQTIEVRKDRPVEIIKVEKTTLELTSQYSGYIKPESVVKYSFSTGGVLNTIAVKEGQHVSPGTELAVVSSDKLNIGVNTATQQQKAAQSQYSKATLGYETLKDAYEQMKALPAEAATAAGITPQAIEEKRVATELAKRDQEMAYAQLQQAKLQTQYSKLNQSDAVMVSDIDGIVLEVLNAPGETVGPGYPVVVIGSANYIIESAFDAEQVRALKVGDSAKCLLSDSETEIEIVGIGANPDQATRTYTVSFAFKDGNNHGLMIGEKVEILLNQGQKNAIWLPISSILNDGQDYVYIVDDNKATRQTIKLLDFEGDLAAVEGLKVGAELIVKGTMGLSHGYPVKIVGESHE